MKIKKQFISVIIIFAVAFVTISVTTIFTQQQAATIEREVGISNEIQIKISNLNFISNNYLLFEQDSELENWASNITFLNSHISELETIELQHTQMLHMLEADIEQANTTFYSTVNYLASTPQNQTIRNDPAFQSNWNGLIESIQTAATSSAIQVQSLHSQRDGIQQSNVILIIILLVVLSMYFLTNYLITFRRTLKSISELEKGAKTVGSGNLDYTLPNSKDDELGGVSKSFNQMTADLKNMTNRLQEHERMVAIGQTAGMVGHDLRNPLHSITGEIYLIQNELNNMLEGPIKAEMKESIDNIAEQISYMDRIVSDLQTFVRPIEANKQITNLKELVHSTLGQIAIPKNIQTKVQIKEIKVNTDPQLLKRVLINLINNSIQAMPNGGELSIKAYFLNQSEFEVIVADTGEGIPDEIKPKIFTPLFTTKYKGQGFGLAVCKRVIEAQGGTISFDSQARKGTIFTIKLPSQD